MCHACDSSGSFRLVVGLLRFVARRPVGTEVPRVGSDVVTVCGGGAGASLVKGTADGRAGGLAGDIRAAGAAAVAQARLVLPKPGVHGWACGQAYRPQLLWARGLPARNRQEVGDASATTLNLGGIQGVGRAGHPGSGSMVQSRLVRTGGRMTTEDRIARSIARDPRRDRCLETQTRAFEQVGVALDELMAVLRRYVHSLEIQGVASERVVVSRVHPATTEAVPASRRRLADRWMVRRIGSPRPSARPPVALEGQRCAWYVMAAPGPSGDFDRRAVFGDNSRATDAFLLAQGGGQGPAGTDHLSPKDSIWHEYAVRSTAHYHFWHAGDPTGERHRAIDLLHAAGFDLPHPSPCPDAPVGDSMLYASRGQVTQGRPGRETYQTVELAPYYSGLVDLVVDRLTARLSRLGVTWVESS